MGYNTEMLLETLPSPPECGFLVICVLLNTLPNVKMWTSRRVCWGGLEVFWTPCELVRQQFKATMSLLLLCITGSFAAFWCHVGGTGLPRGRAAFGRAESSDPLGLLGLEP